MKRKKTILGTGLIALDKIQSEESSLEFAGGSCGNVLTILSYLGWNSIPLGRLKNNRTSEKIILDFQKWNVNTTQIELVESGSSPIIVQENYLKKDGTIAHRFTFLDEDQKTRFPVYKPLLKSRVGNIIDNTPLPEVFYFDRISPGIVELAKFYHENGVLVYFEPSSTGDKKLFSKALRHIHILKYSFDRLKPEVIEHPVDNSFIEIVTQGNLGLQFRKGLNENWKKLKPLSIESGKMVDASGAGDWLTAGFIHKLFQDKGDLVKPSITNISNALQFGQALSSMNCYFTGARGIMYELESMKTYFGSKKFTSSSILKKRNNFLYLEDKHHCEILSA